MPERNTDTFHATMPFGVVAVDIGGTKIASALVLYQDNQTAPDVMFVESVATDARRGGPAVLDTVVESVRRVLNQSAEFCVTGIGVGTAGCVDAQAGTIAFANDLMPGWTGQPVVARIRDEFGLPVALMGDVHAHALGEARWGAARYRHSCLLVAAGTGLGGAFVQDGRVMRGAHGMAGHIGHTLHPGAVDVLCSCGKTAHAESITSGTGIAAHYLGVSPAEIATNPEINGGDVCDMAWDGNQKAFESLLFAGKSLGQAIGSWVNIFDPETVILTGSVTEGGPKWRLAVDEGFLSQVLDPLRGTPIIEAELGGNAPLIGAAENLVDELGGRDAVHTQGAIDEKDGR